MFVSAYDTCCLELWTLHSSTSQTERVFVGVYDIHYPWHFGLSICQRIRHACVCSCVRHTLSCVLDAGRSTCQVTLLKNLHQPLVANVVVGVFLILYDVPMLLALKSIHQGLPFLCVLWNCLQVACTHAVQDVATCRKGVCVWDENGWKCQNIW